MSLVLSAARRVSVGLFASVSLYSLDLSIARAQPSTEAQLPPIEVTKPADQNRTPGEASTHRLDQYEITRFDAAVPSSPTQG